MVAKLETRGLDSLGRGLLQSPAERMKAKFEHTVPLSAAVIDLLRNMPRDGDLVFPGTVAGQPLSGG